MKNFLKLFSILIISLGFLSLAITGLYELFKFIELIPNEIYTIPALKDTTVTVFGLVFSITCLVLGMYLFVFMDIWERRKYISWQNRIPILLLLIGLSVIILFNIQTWITYHIIPYETFITGIPLGGFILNPSQEKLRKLRPGDRVVLKNVKDYYNPWGHFSFMDILCGKEVKIDSLFEEIGELYRGFKIEVDLEISPFGYLCYPFSAIKEITWLKGRNSLSEDDIITEPYAVEFEDLKPALCEPKDLLKTKK